MKNYTNEDLFDLSNKIIKLMNEETGTDQFNSLKANAIIAILKAVLPDSEIIRLVNDMTGVRNTTNR